MSTGSSGNEVEDDRNAADVERKTEYRNIVARAADEQAELIMSLVKPVTATMVLTAWFVITMGPPAIPTYIDAINSYALHMLSPSNASDGDSGGDSGGGEPAIPSNAASVFSLNETDLLILLVIAIAYAVIFVFLIFVSTTLVVLLFKYRCYKLIWGWLSYSVAVLLFVFGGYIFYQSIVYLNITIDIFSFLFLLANFAMGGLMAIFWRGPLWLQQVYLVIVSAILAVVFTRLPEVTTWVVLCAVALYDLYAVLTPKGPLKHMITLAEERKQAIPGLIYSSKYAKLGLGDFVFYSVLLGRAVLYDYVTGLAAYLAVVAGLIATLFLLGIGGKALPALPFSIGFGFLSYILVGYFTVPFTTSMVEQNVYV